MAYQPKSYRKFLAGSVSAALVATAIGPVAASAESASFSDVSADHWAHMYITELANEGIINGFPDGTFGPQVELTRGQAAKLFQRALNLEVPEDLTSFDDVADSTDEELKEAAAAVKAAGIFKGSNGVFGASDTLTRAQMASVLVRAFGLEANDEVEVTLTDLDLIDESHRENVAILFQNGVTTGKEDGTYDGSGSVPRANFAAFLYRSLNMEASAISEVTVVDSTTIDVVFNSVLEEVNVEDFTFDNDLEVLEAEILVEEEAGEEEVEAAAEGMTTVRLTTSLQEDGVEYTLSYMGEAVDTVIGFTPVDPEVVAVNALNLKQVEVVFNTLNDIDEDELYDASNYTFVDEDDNEIEVSDVEVDGTTAVLVLDSAAPNQSTFTLEIGSSVIDTEDTEITFFDTTIPELVESKVVGNDTIKFIFSEPIKTHDEDGNALDLTDAFEFGNNDFFVKSVTPVNAAETEFNVELYSELEEGKLQVSIDNSLEDYAGFNLVATKFEIDVVEDTEAPTVVDYKNATPFGVTLVFDEDIAFTDDADLMKDFYHTNSKNTVVTDAEIVNGNELKLTFANGVNEDADNALPPGTAYIYVDGEAIVDLWDNVNENQIRFAVEVDVDTTKPEVEDITAVSESKFEIEFTEQLESVDKDNFTLLKDGDEKKYIKKAYFKADSENKVVVLEFTDALSGEYSLVIEDLEDLSGNEIDTVTETFNVDDLTAPVINEDFTAKLYSADEDIQKLVVDFGESMEVEGEYSIVDLEKYVLIDGTTEIHLDEVDDVKIKATDKNTKVEILIPADELDLDKDGGYDLKVARVADASGNKTTKLLDSVKSFDDAGHVRFDGDVEAIASDELVVTFNDYVKFKEQDLKVVVDPAGQAIELTIRDSKVSTNDDDNTVVTLKLAEDLTAAGLFDEDADPTTQDLNVVVEVQKDLSENGYGETLELTDSANVVDGIVPELDADNVSVDDTTGEITLTFTEDINALDLVLASREFIITDDENDTLLAGVDYLLAAGVEANELVIQLQDNNKDYATDWAGTLDIETVESINYISDGRNELAAFDDLEVEVDTEAATNAADVAADEVALDAAALAFKVGNEEDTLAPAIELVTTGANGSTITWVSGTAANLSNAGVVTRKNAGDGTETVVFTATITKGTAQETAVFSVAIPDATDLGGTTFGDVVITKP
ncbi:S-layer homology domain-containing protein [Bacillus sp. SCS-151]|uniref:S-layer homology domain-containing protein n=1 Tax=Nanhaiella sioensis TaxID=3115293 RepID=UPI00397AF35D